MTTGTDSLALDQERDEDVGDILEDWEAYYIEHEADIDYRGYLDWLKEESE